MATGQKNIAGAVSALLTPVITEMGYQLWDVEYVREGARWILRITIDTPDGISIDDCEKVHRKIDPILDEADPIADSYYLEVSSPGVERTLRLPSHYAYAVGQKIQCKLFQPLDGSKLLTGILTAYEEKTDEITLACGEKTYTLPRAEIAKANIAFQFS